MATFTSRHRALGVLLAATVTATACGADAPSSPAVAPTPERDVIGIAPPDVDLRPSDLAEGTTSATVIGDPTTDGLYVSLGDIAEGVVFPTHTHPDDRITTVLSGTMYYDVGPEFDRDRVTAHPAGSVILTPAGTPHTMWARDGAIRVQESGYGPSGLELTDAAP